MCCPPNLEVFCMYGVPKNLDAIYGNLDEHTERHFATDTFINSLYSVGVIISKISKSLQSFGIHKDPVRHTKPLQTPQREALTIFGLPNVHNTKICCD
jgi:hypothetical protein